MADNNTKAGRSESVRSNNPPCPGNKVPESFASTRRLNHDAKRSPKVPTTPTIAPSENTKTETNKNEIQNLCDGSTGSPIPPKEYNSTNGDNKMNSVNPALNIPAAKPSHVFFGLNLGASLRLP